MAQNSYITAAEMAESFDSRIILQLSSYSGTPASSVTNSVTANAIEKASAEVETYALRGGFYTTTNLTDLQTADDWALKGLVATLAMKFLYLGKTGNMPPDMDQATAKAEQMLEDLRAGKRVFNLDTVHAAGRASPHVVSMSVRGQINAASDQRFFPQRRTRQF